jgi:hypothetical protein
MYSDRLIDNPKLPLAGGEARDHQNHERAGHFFQRSLMKDEK